AWFASALAALVVALARVEGARSLSARGADWFASALAALVVALARVDGAHSLSAHCAHSCSITLSTSRHIPVDGFLFGSSPFARLTADGSPWAKSRKSRFVLSYAGACLRNRRSTSRYPSRCAVHSS